MTLPPGPVTTSWTTVAVTPWIFRVSLRTLTAIRCGPSEETEL
jgi:hypothetical protein